MRAPLPAWLFLPAGLGALLIIVPILGLVAKTDFANFFTLVTSESALVALSLSLRTSLVSAALCLLVGVPLGMVLARTRFPGRGLLRTFVLLPLVMPPVVGGIALLYTFGRMGLVGRYLEAGGIQIAFTWVAVVLAQTFVSLPFMVMTVEAALSSQDERYEIVGLGLGASPGYVLRRVTLPMLRPALITGAVLAFARSLGEFGATITFAGSLQGTTRTLPLEIYLQRETDTDAAVALSLVLVIIAVVIVLGTYGLQGRRPTQFAAALRGRSTRISARGAGARTPVHRHDARDADALNHRGDSHPTAGGGSSRE